MRNTQVKSLGKHIIALDNTCKVYTSIFYCKIIAFFQIQILFWSQNVCIYIYIYIYIYICMYVCIYIYMYVTIMVKE